MNESELKKLENKLWSAADKMRGAVSVSDYKFIVLGLIFLKYISDSFEDKYRELIEEREGLEEERDCYIAENIFYVPKKARWEYLVEHSKDANIGEIIDNALAAIEKENTSLKNVLPKNYNSPTLRNVNLGELIDLFTNIKVGTKEAKEKDLLGIIYEYFLGQFAKNELQKGGEFYTPACLVRTMVECIEPFQGKVYDPACGSGGMFVQSMKFVDNHQGNPYNIGIFGQEKNPTTWRLAKMNLAIRSMYGDLGNYAVKTSEEVHFLSKFIESNGFYGNEIIYDGKAIVVGEGEFQTDYKKSMKENTLPLLYSALALSSKDEQCFQVVLGLPIQQYKNNKAELIKLIEENRAKTVEVNGKKRDIFITDITIAPEGASAYYNLSKENGLPVISYILMSMSESWRGNGWYNEDIGEYALKNPKNVVNEEYKEAIKERLTYFSQTIGEAFDFRAYLLAEQCSHVGEWLLRDGYEAW